MFILFHKKPLSNYTVTEYQYPVKYFESFIIKNTPSHLIHLYLSLTFNCLRLVIVNLQWGHF